MSGAENTKPELAAARVLIDLQPFATHIRGDAVFASSASFWTRSLANFGELYMRCYQAKV